MNMKLKYPINLKNMFQEKYISLEEASELYTKNEGSSSRIAQGFFSIKLSFSDWLEHYNIKVF
jgi:hypothetical protein